MHTSYEDTRGSVCAYRLLSVPTLVSNIMILLPFLSRGRSPALAEFGAAGTFHLQQTSIRVFCAESERHFSRDRAASISAAAASASAATATATTISDSASQRGTLLRRTAKINENSGPK